MNRLKLTIILITGLILMGCQSIEDTQTQLENPSNVETESSQDTSNTQDTTYTTPTDTETIDTDTTPLENTQNTSETSSEVTTLLDTSSQNTTSTQTSTNDTPTDTTSLTTPKDNDYTNMVIPMYATSEYITRDMCNEISEYFDSMVNNDIDTFQSKQLSAYNSYMNEYLTENNSSISDMLNTYGNNFLKSTGDDTLEYTDFSFNSITLDYPNDMDSILNTMDYIDQLDQITTQYEDYILSTQLTAYYQLDYTIDYTLTGENLDDFNSTKTGSILVLDVNGDISLIMLY